jgi:hypothetical protein
MFLATTQCFDQAFKKVCTAFHVSFVRFTQRHSVQQSMDCPCCMLAAFEEPFHRTVIHPFVEQLQRRKTAANMDTTQRIV